MSGTFRRLRLAMLPCSQAATELTTVPPNFVPMIGNGILITINLCLATRLHRYPVVDIVVVVVVVVGLFIVCHSSKLEVAFFILLLKFIACIRIRSDGAAVKPADLPEILVASDAKGQICTLASLDATVVIWPEGDESREVRIEMPDQGVTTSTTEKCLTGGEAKPLLVVTWSSSFQLCFYISKVRGNNTSLTCNRKLSLAGCGSNIFN